MSETYTDKSKPMLILFIVPNIKTMRKKERLLLWHVTYSFFTLCTEERTRHRKWHCRFTRDRQRASSEGCKITLAKSSGWSHHKEDKTKGHSKPWIICCCHPTPSHNPSLCDSLFWSYVMNGRLWSALSIPMPHYSNKNNNILWPELSRVCRWRAALLGWGGKGGQLLSTRVCPCAKMKKCSCPFSRYVDC